MRLRRKPGEVGTVGNQEPTTPFQVRTELVSDKTQIQAIVLLFKALLAVYDAYPEGDAASRQRTETVGEAAYSAWEKLVGPAFREHLERHPNDDPAGLAFRTGVELGMDALIVLQGLHGTPR